MTDNTLTIVSGLPRSGTSMMMKMLDAGGMVVVTDNVREADDDNPKGYYEFEEVKRIREDRSWLQGTEGKAVKMVSMLLYDLPPDRHYKVLFMRRHMDEILSSQRVMLRRRDEGADFDEQEMGRLFEMHVREVEDWLRCQPNIETLFVEYRQVITEPAEVARQVREFLARDLDTIGMARVVDASLYRQRGAGCAGGLGTPVNEAEGREAGGKDKIEAQLTSLGYM